MSQSLVRTIEEEAKKRGISRYQMAVKLDCHKSLCGWKTGKYHASHRKTQHVLNKLNELNQVTRIAHELMNPTQIKESSVEKTKPLCPPLVSSILRSDLPDSDKVTILCSIFC